MRGHVKKRSTWEFVVELGLQPLQRCPACRKRYWTERALLPACPKCQGPLEGRRERRQEFHTGYGSKREAEDALAKVLSSLSDGSYIEPSKTLLGDFLMSEWLPAIRATIRPTTFISYQGHVQCHIAPALGRISLQQLSGAQINIFYATLLSKKVPGGAHTLSPSTVRRVHASLHRALKDAVRWNKISRNPADAADPPRAAAGPEMKVWSVKELQRFLAAERDSRLYPLWLTLATTGMRRGEALGLTWEDLDVEAGRLTVRRTRVMTAYEAKISTPKTRKGRRLIALDPATLAALTSLRAREKRESLARGVPWSDAFYLFTREDGAPYHPERASKLFVRAAKRTRLPGIRLHDLRHTYATVALSAGIHPKIVSERLGHANIGITLDCYSHVLPALSEEAACRVAALMLPSQDSQEPGGASEGPLMIAVI